MHHSAFIGSNQNFNMTVVIRNVLLNVVQLKEFMKIYLILKLGETNNLIALYFSFKIFRIFN